MKKNYWLVLLIAFAACSTVKEDILLGKWKAASIFEENKPLDYDISTVGLQFNTDQTYTYTGTLNYHEAGKYFIDKQYLVTIDTINSATTEKLVEIIKISEDSLHLKMNTQGKERLLKLVKQ